jgi:hypothetical protein
MADGKAIDSFLPNVATIGRQLDAIRELAENHFNAHPDEVNWGDVGSSDLVVQHLADILAHYGQNPHGEKTA